jgi:sulfur relay (sulfurtransferase) DsrC/TusE family protein
MTKAITGNISMYDEWQIVEIVSQYHGFNNTSAAVRFIVREYARQNPQVFTPGQPGSPTAPQEKQ